MSTSGSSRGSISLKVISMHLEPYFDQGHAVILLHNITKLHQLPVYTGKQFTPGGNTVSNSDVAHLEEIQ